MKQNNSLIELMMNCCFQIKEKEIHALEEKLQKKEEGQDKVGLYSLFFFKML